MTFDRAMVIALDGLRHIAGDDRLLERFCRECGVLPDDLRRSAGEPEFLGGVLDFLLAEEPRLLAFCAVAQIAPGEPARARAALPGAEGNSDT